MKGFLSFDISALHGADVIICHIEFKHIGHSNHPESFASNIIVSVADYGDSLDIHDFYVVSWTFLAGIPVTATNFLILGTGPDFDDTVPLRYELQKTIGDGKD